MMLGGVCGFGMGVMMTRMMGRGHHIGMAQLERCYGREEPICRPHVLQQKEGRVSQWGACEPRVRGSRIGEWCHVLRGCVVGPIHWWEWMCSRVAM